MATKTTSFSKPKHLAEVNKTNNTKCYLYHKIIHHPIKNCYVFKDIIEDIIRRGEIEIEGALPKGPTESSNATSTVEQNDDSHASSSEINEGIPTVSLPSHVVPIKFIVDDNVTIVWTYPDMPPLSPGVPTLYDFYLDPSLEAWAISEDDDSGFEWQTTSIEGYFNKEWLELLIHSFIRNQNARMEIAMKEK